MRQSSPSPSQPRALIVGGSIAGLFCALLLRRSGWLVDVFERAGGELGGRGAGIVTHPELFSVLERAGLDAGETRVGVFVPGRRVFSRDGRIAGEIDLPQILTSWGHLYRLLRAALPNECSHAGANCVAFEDHGRPVVILADGSRVQGDLLIGADGLHSTVRRHFAPDLAPLYAGYVAWRGLVEERDLSPAVRAALCGHFVFCLPEGEQMLGYPVAGPDGSMQPGSRRFNFVWYRPAEAGGRLGELLTDTDGIRHELSIPPDRIRPQVVAAMCADSARLLAPQFADVVAAARQPFLQAILDFETPRMRLAPRTVILGDAAFVARPHVGMGITKAAGDAAALAENLAAGIDDIDAALDRFAARRLAFGRAVVTRARALGAYMQAQMLTQDERDDAARYRTPAAVMAETAVATGLAA